MTNNKTTKRNKSFKKQTKVNVDQQDFKPIDSVFKITKNSLDVLIINKKLFAGIMLIYGIIYILFIQGITNLAVNNSLSLTGPSKIFDGVGTFAQVLSGTSQSSSSPSGSSFQAFMLIIVTLVIIWTLRQIYNGSKVRVRDGYYKAMYPLIPFILILLFIGLELLPMLIGSTLYNVVISEGIAVNAFEKIFAVVILIGLIMLSLYWISSSIFALYIVTLPDMAPISSLRSAKRLVKGRRLTVFLKLIYLPILITLVTTFATLPFIFIYPKLITLVIFIVSLFVIVFVNSYLYSLYRELIK